MSNKKPRRGPQSTSPAPRPTPAAPPSTAPKKPIRRTRQPNWSLIGGIAVVALLIGWYLFRTTSDTLPAEAQKIADMGQGLHLDSVDDALPVAYNSNPPTSGWHVGNTLAPWGIQNQPIDDKISVHNIEHGGIIIHYRASLESADVQKLDTLARELQRRNPCVVMVPRPDDRIEAPVVVTAWNYLMPLAEVDTAKITSFFESRIGRGPEQVCTTAS
jgi:hypothetical protein